MSGFFVYSQVGKTIQRIHLLSSLLGDDRISVVSLSGDLDSHALQNEPVLLGRKRDEL